MDKNLEYEPVRGAHILMIVNPVSGRIGGEHTADKLEAWLKENGAAVDRFETTETENGSGYTQSSQKTTMPASSCSAATAH